MDPTIIAGIIAAAVQAVPAFIKAVQDSQTMTEEQKAAALDALSGQLDAVAAQVKAVQLP